MKKFNKLQKMCFADGGEAKELNETQVRPDKGYGKIIMINDHDEDGAQKFADGGSVDNTVDDVITNPAHESYKHLAAPSDVQDPSSVPKDSPLRIKTFAEGGEIIGSDGKKVPKDQEEDYLKRAKESSEAAVRQAIYNKQHDWPRTKSYAEGGPVDMDAESAAKDAQNEAIIRQLLGHPAKQMEEPQAPISSPRPAMEDAPEDKEEMLRKLSAMMSRR